MKRLINNLFFSLIVAGITIILLEFCFSIVNRKLNFPHGHIDPGIGGKSTFEYPCFIKDKYVYWRFDPAQKGINKIGLREKEISIIKDKNVIRIICMGDSVTFGPGVHNTYPQILSQLLCAYYKDKKIEVFNASIPGYTSYQGLQLLKNDILKLHPDIVIAYFGINDAGYNTNGKSDKAQSMPPRFIINILNTFRNSQILKFLARTDLYIRYLVHKKNIILARRVEPCDYRENIRLMRIILDKANGKLLFVANPTWYNPVNKNVFTESAYYCPNDIPSINIYSIFKQKESNGRVYFLNDTVPFYFHLTEEGLRVLAGQMFQFLVSNRWLEI